MKLTIKAIFIYLFLSIPTFLLAQQKLDTIFYDRYWSKTTIKDSVHFYRIATKLENNYKVEDYYVSNKIQMIGYVVSLHQNSKTGHFQYFYENGNLSSEGNFEYNEREGTWKYYYENRKIWYQAFYYKGLKNGELKSFYRSGEVKRKAKFKLDVLVKEKCYDSKVNNADFLPIIVDPMFVGGEMIMHRFLSENIIYPQKAKDDRIGGRVVVRFLVTKKGVLDSFEIISQPQPILDEAAIEAIKKMPTWIPSKADCEFRDEHFVYPIQFILD